MPGMPPLITRPVSANPPGTALSRLLMIMAVSRGDDLLAAELGERFRDTPHVGRLLATKSAIVAGTTTDVSWAAALAQYGVSQELFTLLQGASIFVRLQSAMRRVPFRVKVPRDMASGSGSAWRGESLPMPVVAGLYDMVALEYFERGTIALLTKELARVGDPIAEAAVRQKLITAIAADLDGQFFDPTIGPTSTHPASITYTAPQVSSTGVTAAALLADLASLIGAITTPADNLRWAMRPQTYYKILATLAGVGGVVSAPNALLGIPVMVSSTMPVSAGSPTSSLIVLLDAAAIAFAQDDKVDLSVSDEAALQATDNPVSGATVLLSLYQTNLFAMRASLGVSWLRAFDGSVAVMTVSI